MNFKSSWMLVLLSANSFAAAELMRADVSSLSHYGRKSDNFQGYIGGISNQLRGEVTDVPGNRYNGSLYFDYHKQPTTLTRGVEGRFTFASMYNDQSALMVSVQEAYIGGKLMNNDDIRVGRQILDWSTIDNVWGFGKLNNRRNFDYFEPGQEGLIGLQYTARANNGFRLSVWGSPIYVPEMNPSLDINKSKGTISSKHAWTNAPEREAEIEPGKFARIEYNVDVPEPQEVVYRFSAGLNVGYDSKHMKLDAFVMRKPENQISAKAEVKVDTIQNVVRADVTPQFYYHDTFGGTVAYLNGKMKIYGSAIAINPNTYPDGDEKATLFTEIPTEKRRESYGGGGISFSDDITTYGVNYVARLSPYDRKTDRLAEDPRWNEAINVFASRRLGKHYTLVGDVKYDRLTADRLMMIRGIYSATKDFQMILGINTIGTAGDGKSFWSPYTNNDSVYGGLRLVF